MSRFFSGLVGSVYEAWHELRTHKTRVMLSLVGVAVAVCALAVVVAAGDLLRQTMAEQSDRFTGRQVTLQVGAMSSGEIGLVDQKLLSDSYLRAVDRYKIEYSSRTARAPQSVQFLDGVVTVQTDLVDQPIQAMRRIRVLEGEWFAKDDEYRLAPAIVVNEAFYQRLGEPDLATHPTVDLVSDSNKTAVIIGVIANTYGNDPAMTMLIDSFQKLPPTEMNGWVMSPEDLQFDYYMWVPSKIAVEIGAAIERDMSADMGDSATIAVNPADSMMDDGIVQTFTFAIGGIAGLVLLLGALSLLNISIVTVKQRVREIGIRRSSGATASRIFFSVMMESVVATVVAGAIGVALAIVIMRSPLVELGLGGMQLEETPPFPVGAAVFGMAAATIIGALAGLIPAIYAVRVKVIDAIRF